MSVYEYRKATRDDLERIWNKNIEKNPNDARWQRWKEQYIGYNEHGMATTFVVLFCGEPVGEGTLLFSENCKAINGRKLLADGSTIANINALRIEKSHEGQGHISKLVKLIEEYAKELGYAAVTIGVEPKEARNLAIYLHWGYNVFILADNDDGELVLYYKKRLS